MGPDNTIQFVHACVHKLFTSVRIEQQQTVKTRVITTRFHVGFACQSSPQKDAQWAFLIVDWMPRTIKTVKVDLTVPTGETELREQNV